jgi:hypothetical protein
VKIKGKTTWEKLRTIRNFSIGFLSIFLGLFVIVYVSFPLFPKSKNEVNKKQEIGMLISSPIEFSGDETFWWLIKGNNSLEFTNASDELIIGNLILKLEYNPCKQKEKLKIDLLENKKTKYYVLDKDLEINFPIEIQARGATQLKIDFYGNEVCLIGNGDKRNFAAKLIRWQFE